MNTTLLMQKLIQIEMAIGAAEPADVRRMLLEVEDYVLEVQRTSVNPHAVAGRLGWGTRHKYEAAPRPGL